MSIADDIEDALSDLADAPGKALEAVEDAVRAGAEAADAALDAISSGIEAVLELGQEVIDKLDDATKAFVEMAKAIAAAAEGLKDIADRALSYVERGLDVIKRAVEGAILDFAELITAGVRWIENNVAAAVDWVVNEALPIVWAGLKLIALLVALYYTWPALLLTILICSAVTEAYSHEYGTVVEAILRGEQRYREMYAIQRMPANGRYVLFSDLHRWAGSDAQDASFVNDSRDLYRRVLEYYGTDRDNWTLVENGDAEDYWLRGGSLYGVAYDAANAFPVPALVDKFLDAALLTIAKNHLSVIIKEHRPTYARILALFHDKGRYLRTVGNHDDINIRTEMQEIFGLVFPGLIVADYIVLEDESGHGIALIGHGHQTDAWNTGACSFLGKITTSAASGIKDLLRNLPIDRDLKNVGMPKEEKTWELWGKGLDNKLDQVGPFGVNTEQGSLDETNLFDGFRRIWGGLGPGVSDAAPWLLLGHTHTALTAPFHPQTHGIWNKYINSGCGIFYRMVTCIEWDRGTARLCAWRWHTDEGGPRPSEIVGYNLVRDGEHIKLDKDTKRTFDGPVPPGV